MTLSLTPTLGVIGSIIFILLPSFFLFLCFALLSWWTNQLTMSLDLNCAFVRCLGAGEQLPKAFVADVTENSCIETLIPQQLLTRLQFFLFFKLHLSFYPWPPSLPQRLIHCDDLYLSIFLSLPHGVGVLENHAWTALCNKAEQNPADFKYIVGFYGLPEQSYRSLCT